MEIYVDDEAKLTLHGLVQHYIMLNEEEKNRKLNELLDSLEFNQVCFHSVCSSCVPGQQQMIHRFPLWQRFITGCGDNFGACDCWHLPVRSMGSLAASPYAAVLCTCNG